MNGVHDLGGMHGFGHLPLENDEPIFHADWERRTFAVWQAMNALGLWNLDVSRATLERYPPAAYLGDPYYRRWLVRAGEMAVDYGLVTAEELQCGRSLTNPRQTPGRLNPGDIQLAVARGRPTMRTSDAAPRFALGQPVRTVESNTQAHTRLPRYARGRRGSIHLMHGVHAFNDSNAAGDGENPQWLYTVRFDGCEIWGPEAEAGLEVFCDAWEAYLQPVDQSEGTHV